MTLLQIAADSPGHDAWQAREATWPKASELLRISIIACGCSIDAALKAKKKVFWKEEQMSVIRALVARKEETQGYKRPRGGGRN
jgi:hypothetical protein